MSSYRRVRWRDDIEEGSRKSQETYQMAVSPFYSTKKGHRQTTDYFRPIPLEQIHNVSYLQDAYLEGREAVTSTSTLHSVPRLEGRVLACTNSSSKETFSGLRVQRYQVPIQSNAIWVEHSPKNLYKTYRSHLESGLQSGHLYARLSGRPSNSGSNRETMQRTSCSSCRDSKRPRLVDKREEISHGTVSKFPMAWSTMGSSTIHLRGSSGDSNQIKVSTSGLNTKKISFPPINHEIPRPSKLVCSNRLIHQTSNVCHQSGAEENQTSPFRQRICSAPVVKDVSHSFHERQICSCPTRCPDSVAGCNDRRFRNRLGHLSPIQSPCRSFPQFYNSFEYSCEGASCDFLGFTNFRPRRSQRSDQHRLTSLSECVEEGSFSQPSSGRVVLSNLASSSQEILESQAQVFTRQLQCDSRSAVERHSNLDRVEHFSYRLSSDSREGWLHTSGGPVCYESKQQDSSLPVPLSRSPSPCNRLNECLLEHLGSPVSVSSDSNDFEGFSEASLHKLQKSSSCVPRLRRETLVQESTPSSSHFQLQTLSSSATRSEWTSDDPGQSHSLSRIHHIERHYLRRFPECPDAAKLMAVPIRKSSQGDYERKWQYFLSFLNKEGVQLESCTIQHIVKFFHMLFQSKGLLASTVAHYRSALSVPLRNVFNIDVLDPAISSMLKAMAIVRPSRPLSAPSWNLQKVLDYAEGLPENASFNEVMAKAAFLLSLATGWRVSELQACVRLSDYCLINREGVLRIRPHESFLAKNESSSSRWNHFYINPLKVDNFVSKLCPVNSLKRYLDISSPKGHGPLFVDNNRRHLSIHELSKLICRFVLEGDPTAKVKVHDIRKLASSLSLMQHMDVKDVMEAMQWKSSSAFYRHYLTVLARPSQSLVIPGGQIHPDEEPDDPRVLEQQPEPGCSWMP